jgi:hypothetical protein
MNRTMGSPTISEQVFGKFMINPLTVSSMGEASSANQPPDASALFLKLESFRI